MLWQCLIKRPRGKAKQEQGNRHNYHHATFMKEQLTATQKLNTECDIYPLSPIQQIYVKLNGIHTS